MAKKLPVFEYLISPASDSGIVVDCVSIVDKPAIEKLFMSFCANEDVNKLNFAKVDTSERTVVGAAMIPDLLMYRDSKELGAHQAFFTKETIKTIAQRFYEGGYHLNGNIMHDPLLKIDGMNYYMSFMRNSEKGMTGLEGDYPDGTWFLGAQITSDDLWEKIKNGEYKGFSVEGIFTTKEVDEDAALLSSIEQLATEGTEAAYDKISMLLMEQK